MLGWWGLGGVLKPSGCRGQGLDEVVVRPLGRPRHSRDLTVTDLPGEPPNLALTRPLPSTSSENLPRESPWITTVGLVPGGYALRCGGGG